MGFDASPIILSFKVSLISTVVTAFLGTAAAFLLYRFRFTGRNLVEALIGLPLVLPPTVVGFGLLIIFGRHGILGPFLENVFHFRVVFTWWAAIIASIVVSLPLMYQGAKAGFTGVDSSLERAARTLGASEWKLFFTVTLPLASPGIFSGLLLAFARGLGEFGATMMLAGNIPGKTQTIPLAIFFSAESGDMTTAGILVGVISAASLVITYWVNSWQAGGVFVQKAGRGDKHAARECEKKFA